MAVEYTIVYSSEAVQTDILSLPDTLAARYKTPARERQIAEARMKEVKHAKS